MGCIPDPTPGGLGSGQSLSPTTQVGGTVRRDDPGPWVRSFASPHLQSARCFRSLSLPPGGWSLSLLPGCWSLSCCQASVPSCLGHPAPWRQERHSVHFVEFSKGRVEVRRVFSSSFGIEAACPKPCVLPVGASVADPSTACVGRSRCSSRPPALPAGLLVRQAGGRLTREKNQLNTNLCRGHPQAVREDQRQTGDPGRTPSLGWRA